MFPRAAVSLYPVNKFGTGRPFAAFFAGGLLAFDGFFRETENGGQKNGRLESRPSAIHS
jgi:hypothetical protein